VKKRVNYIWEEVASSSDEAAEAVVESEKVKNTFILKRSLFN